MRLYLYNPIKVMRKNKFKLFASFLNKNGDHSEKKLFASPEEQAEYDKLDFL